MSGGSMGWAERCHFPGDDCGPSVLTPTEYLVMDLMAARWRLGDDSWTFPNTFRPTLQRLADRGHLAHKSGVCAGTQQAWLLDGGKRFLRLDRPYVLRGKQVGRVWGRPGDDLDLIERATRVYAIAHDVPDWENPAGSHYDADQIRRIAAVLASDGSRS